MRDPFTACGSVRETTPNPYRCDQVVGHEGPHSASIPIGATPTLRITTWNAEDSDDLVSGTNLLNTAIERLNRALDVLPEEQAAMHVPPTLPAEIERLVARLRQVLGDVVG